MISIKDGRDRFSGAIDAANAVPSSAKAVAFNVTATSTTSGSFLSVVPGNVTSSNVSTLNWTGAGVSIANDGIVGVDAARQVRIIAGPAGTFDAIVDITGFYSESAPAAEHQRKLAKLRTAGFFGPSAETRPRGGQ